MKLSVSPEAWGPLSRVRGRVPPPAPSAGTYLQAASCLSHRVGEGRPLFLPPTPGPPPAPAPLSSGIRPLCTEPAMAAPFTPQRESGRGAPWPFVGDSVPSL